jgi:Predicted pPIWI-associating nuclease
LGLLGADVLKFDIEDDELVQATVERVELDVLEVSALGRLRAASELCTRLAQTDPTVTVQLEGAWDDIERNGPTAVNKAANCVVEVLDQTLRAVAPEDDVRGWHMRTGRTAKDFGNQGQVTRALRVKYVAAEIGGARKLAVSLYESFADLLDPLYRRLQAAKHASAADVTRVRSLLLTAESFLPGLLLSAID